MDEARKENYFPPQAGRCHCEAGHSIVWPGVYVTRQPNTTIGKLISTFAESRRGTVPQQMVEYLVMIRNT